MQRFIRLHSFLICSLIAVLPLAAPAALDTNRIAQVTGLPGSWSVAEGVFKVTAPATKF